MKFIMLVGLPGVGKDTWLSKQGYDDSYIIVSSDEYIESKAAERGVLYNDVWQKEAGAAQTYCFDRMKEGFALKKNVILNQTNLTRNSRRKKLIKVPDDYEKEAVYLSPPDSVEHERRLNSRPGKTIPKHILLSMRNSFEYPSNDEGFKSIRVVQ